VGPRTVLSGLEQNFQPPPGIEPQNPDHPARSLVAIPTELSRLLKMTNSFSNIHTPQVITNSSFNLSEIEAKK
jgi:hypothetical protein